MKKCIVALILLGCGSSTPPPESAADEMTSAPAPVESTEPACLDTNGEPQTCLSDEDCCRGFTCAKDPEGSTRERVCLYEY